MSERAPARGDGTSPTTELTQRYLQVVSKKISQAEMYEQLSELTRELINARFVRWCPETQTTSATATQDQSEGESEDVSELKLEADLDDLLKRANQENRTLIEPGGFDNQSTDVAIPFPGHGTLLCRLVAQPAMLQTFVALLKMAAGYFVMAGALRQQSGMISLAATAQNRLRLMEGIFQPGSKAQVFGSWCDQLSALVDSSLVLICLAKHPDKKCALVAQSGDSQLDTRGEVARLASRLADESKLARRELETSLSNSGTIKSRTAAGLAAHLGVSSAEAFPIVDSNGTPWGAVIVVGNDRSDSQRQLLQQIVTGSSAALLFKSGRQSLAAASLSGAATTLRRTFLVLATVVALVGLMAIPVPYQVRCSMNLQPEVRRVVSSPFDAVLTKAIAQTGDVVKAGDVIGQLDDDPLKLELSKNETERVRVQKRHEVHLANGEIAEAQLTELRLEELNAAMDLLNERIQQARIIAPIAGVVISENLEDFEDSPVELGQTLFEIAPLDSLRAEIEIPDHHAHLIRMNQSARLWVDNGAGSRVEGQLTRVAPRVEVLGDRSVLKAEIDVDNQDGLLRPGMDGQAAVNVGKKQIGWILFHRLWNRARIYIGV